ncbi:hypothetical protein [Oryzobacter terrae]|uniref:hypothetical protein n=1 Tax=Oryzobacter terrae TaxID=1620385 RepID=UPI00366B9CEA
MHRSRPVTARPRRPSRPSRARAAVAATACLVVAVLGACSGATPSPERRVELTRYGAPVATWEATHDKAAGFESSYLPLVEPGKPYYHAVDTSEGDRVLWYGLQFARGTDVATARERVLAEFPPGAVVERQVDDAGDCALLFVRSREVAAVLGHGLVEVQLTTEGTGPFRPDDVSLALMSPPFEDERSDLVLDPFC